MEIGDIESGFNTNRELQNTCDEIEEYVRILTSKLLYLNYDDDRTNYYRQILSLSDSYGYMSQDFLEAYRLELIDIDRETS